MFSTLSYLLINHLYYSADEHLAELMPIFNEIRARGEIGNAYPLHVGSTAGPTLHMAHVNPNTCYWVIHRFYYIIYLRFHLVFYVVVVVVSVHLEVWSFSL